jgi:GntR family transcriptional regulator
MHVGPFRETAPKAERMQPRAPAPFAGPVPRYHRVFTVLREQIAQGVYGRTEPMPGEMELAAMFKVSRVTIRHALDKLQQEGLIERRQGVGTFARPNLNVKTVSADLNGFIDNLLNFGLETSVEVLEFDYVAAPPEIAAQLSLPPGATVQKAVRRRSYDGRPFSIATTYTPERIGRTFDREELARERLLSLLIRASGGVASAHQRVSATIADPATAQLLGIDYGAPLLSITRVACDRAGAPINYIRALYRPDTYEFSIDLATDTSPSGTMWRPLAADTVPSGPDEADAAG